MDRKIILPLVFIALYLSFLPSIYAQNTTFSIDKLSFTEKLEAYSTYLRRIQVTSNISQQIKFSLDCINEPFCDWVSFVQDNGRFAEVSYNFQANKSYYIYFQIDVPKDFESNEYIFNIIAEAGSQKTLVNVKLSPNVQYSTYDNVAIFFDGIWNYQFYVFPENSFLKGNGIYGSTLILIVFIFAVAIIFIRVVHWLRGGKR